MARGTVDITFRARGAQAVRSAIRGVAQDSRKADRDSISAARRVEREKAQAARRATQVQIRSAQWAAREEARLARETARAHATAERERVRAAARADAEIRRAAQRTAREATQRMRLQERQQRQVARGVGVSGSRGAAALGGGAAVAGGLALATVTRAFDAFAARLDTIATSIAGATGQLGVGERTTAAMTFDTNLRRSSGEFFQGQSPEEVEASMAALREEIAGVAIESAQSPTALLDVLSTMQTEFSQFEEGRANLRAIALEAQRTGADMTQLARFIGVLNHQLGDTAPTAERAFDVMAQQGLDGAITPEQLATEFGGMFGQFRDMSGLQGEDALRQFGALANALKTKDMSAAETATLMQNLMNDLGSDRVRGRLIEATGGRMVTRGGAEVQEGGTQALHADGTVDFLQLIEDMSANEQIGTSNIVFRNSMARQAAGQLTSLHRRDAAGEDVMTAAELAAIDADAGARVRAGNLDTVMQGPEIVARRQGVQTQLEGIGSLGVRSREAETDNAWRNLAESDALTSVWNDSIPDFMVPFVSRAASFAGRMSPEARGGLQQAGQMASSLGVAPAASLLTGVSSLAGIGSRMNTQIDEARTGTPGETRVQGTVGLDTRTIEALATAFSRRMPKERVPGRGPG